jgi:hypothetical protein
MTPDTEVLHGPLERLRALLTLLERPRDARAQDELIARTCAAIADVRRARSVVAAGSAPPSPPADAYSAS